MTTARSKEVEVELGRMRAHDEAKRIIAAENRQPVELPQILTLRQRLLVPWSSVRWRINGWQPLGSRVIAAAPFKAGKTTLTGNLVRSLIDGEPWLDQADVLPLEGTLWVLDFEMGDRQLTDWLAAQGIRNDDRVHVVSLRGRASAFDLFDDVTRSEWAQRLAGCEYLIVDCLRPILDSFGLDEHRDVGRFLTAFDALLAEAKIPDCCLIHHHGHTAERSRGDSRLRDWPDVEWNLVREDPDNSGSPRYISAYGRDVEVNEARLEFDPVTRHLSLIGGSRAGAATRAALVAIETLLHESPQLSGNRIELDLIATEHSRGTIRKALALGVQTGVIKVEAGPRNSRLHSLTSPVRRTSPPVRQQGPHHFASSLIDGEVSDEVLEQLDFADAQALVIQELGATEVEDDALVAFGARR